MNPFWLTPAIVCYLAAAIGFAWARASGRDRWTRGATIALAVGALSHTVALVANGLRAGNMPVTNLAESVSFLAWLTAIAVVIVIIRLHLAVIGAFVTPLIFVATAGSWLATRGQTLQMPAPLRSAWLPVHVTLAFAGFALFVLAAGVSLVYLVLERRLKKKLSTTETADRTPSLERLDRINYCLLGWGFLMLSLAIISGAIWADSTWGHFWSWEPQECWSLVVWLMYAGLLESRLSAGWRGGRVAALTLVVFTVLLGSFVGVSLVTPGKHGGSFG
jgi:cytochrome c-type biogenesis protein CcsB